MSDSSSKKTYLVTATGPDAPGITSGLTAALTAGASTILDIGQSVLHNWLSLSILFEIEMVNEKADEQVLKDLLFEAEKRGMKLKYREVSEYQAIQERRHQASRYAVTLIAGRVSGQILHSVTQILQDYQLNIDRLEQLTQDDLGCVEMIVSSSVRMDDQRAIELKDKLLSLGKDLDFDIAFQREGLFRRTKRLVVFDMDSTLIQNEVIDEFARELGVYDEVAAITEEAMRGKLDFTQSLKRRVGMLKGLSSGQVERVYERIQLSDGAEELIKGLRTLGYRIAIISGGFRVIAERLAKRLNIDYVYANDLVFNNELATGSVREPIVDGPRKALLLTEIASREKIRPEQVIAIGDGANDLFMLEKAGLGIAFNAKPHVSDKADMALNRRNLRSIFYLLGYTTKEIEDVLSS
jgi:phosphoserine phosphatase